MAKSLFFGPFRLDLGARQLWRGDHLVSMTPRALDVLVYLADHAGQIVHRDELFSALWPGVFVADHALSVQILEIRKALRDDAQKPVYIETRHRRGYCFRAPVRVVESSSLQRIHGMSSAATASAAVPAPAFAPPRTCYADSGGVKIAYQVVGDGPVDLVFVMGWVSHLEYFWTEPRFARFLRRMSSFARVVLFDKRGTGLSDQVPLDQLPTIEQRIEDVHAVMDAIGSERAVLCGISKGGCMSAAFAATYPERAAGLILIGTYARRLWAPDYPWAPTAEQRELFLDEIRQHWGGPVGLEDRAPSVANDPQFREWWATYLRMGASPSAALALTVMNSEADIRHVLPLIRVPTLVLHRTGDRCLPVQAGRFIASQVPGATLVELDGDDHLPFVGDQESILEPIESFVVKLPNAVDTTGVLATALTMELSETPGDALEAALRSEVGNFGARDAALDGTLLIAAFNGPVRALHCAAALSRIAEELGMRSRIGLHTGEFISDRSGNPRGSAVVVARQVARRAKWDQLLATGTLRDLVAGSGFAFQASGRLDVAELGEWQLLEVRKPSPVSL